MLPGLSRHILPPGDQLLIFTVLHNPFSERLSDFEERKLFGPNANLLSCLGISASVAFVFSDLEGPKIPEFNPLLPN